MNEEETPRNPLKDALASFHKPRPFPAGPYDRYEARPLNKTDNEALRDQDESQAFDEAGLSRALIGRVVRPIGTDDALASRDAARLAHDPEFLEQLITLLPELYDALGAFAYRDARSGIENSKHSDPFVERLPDESPAAFLLRAWREYEKREKEMRATLRETMTSTFNLPNYLSAAGKQSLAAGLSASDNLSRLIDRMKGLPDPVGAALTQPRDCAPIALPPNPIHETNARLADVAGAVADLRELASQTAAMQQSLNAVATEILAKFAAGAEESRVASEKTLDVANKSLWVAIASIGIAILLAIVQIATSGPSRSEIDHQRRLEQLSGQEAAAAGAQTRLLQDVSKQLEAQQSELERLAAETRKREADRVKALPAPKIR